MFEPKNENSERLTFCNKCVNFKSYDWGSDECHASENFDHYGTTSEKVTYWKQPPSTLNAGNSCPLFVPKQQHHYFLLTITILCSLGAVVLGTLALLRNAGIL
jgi:hypothetical protein